MIAIFFAIVSLVEYWRLYTEKTRYLENFGVGDTTGHFLKFSALIKETIETDLICALILLLIIGFEIFTLVKYIRERKQPKFI